MKISEKVFVPNKTHMNGYLSHELQWWIFVNQVNTFILYVSEQLYSTNRLKVFCFLWFNVFCLISKFSTFVQIKCLSKGKSKQRAYKSNRWYIWNRNLQHLSHLYVYLSVMYIYIYIYLCVCVCLRACVCVCVCLYDVCVIVLYYL